MTKNKKLLNFPYVWLVEREAERVVLLAEYKQQRSEHGPWIAVQSDFLLV